MYRKVARPDSTFCNKFFQLFQLEILKFVAWKVEDAVGNTATTSLTCNATMSRDKLNENVTRITEAGNKQIPDLINMEH